MTDPSTAAPPLARRSLKRRLLLAVGFAIALGGGLYSWFVQGSSDEARAWQAYESRQYDVAIDRFTAILKKKPHSAGALAGRSWAHIGRREWRQALADSNKALELDPEAALAYHARGDAEAALGDTEKALHDLDEAIGRGDRTTTAYYDRARIRYSATGATEQPLADLTRATRLDRTYGPAYSLQGLILLGLQQYDEAIDACTRALEADPHDARALLCRGHARLAKGQPLGADDIAEAKKLDPSLER